LENPFAQAQYGRKYARSPVGLTRANVTRQSQITMRYVLRACKYLSPSCFNFSGSFVFTVNSDASLFVPRLFQSVLFGLIVGSLFW